MKILLIRLSSMGDVILVSPVITYLNGKYHDSSITLLTSSAYASLFEGDSRLSSVIGIKKGELPCKAILKDDFDLVFDLQNSSKSRRLLKSLGINTVTGVFKKPRIKRLLLLLLRIDLYGSAYAVASAYIKAVGGDTLTPVPALKLDFGDQLPESFRRWENEGNGQPVIALFPFSAWKNKQWPLEYFVQVGRHYAAKGWRVLILGGKEDISEANAAIERIKENCLSLAGKLTLNECGKVLSRCSLALGNDTGLSHLARACGVKTGVIFGPTTRHFGFYPYANPPYKVFELKMLCRPCHLHGGNRCPLIHWGCMKKLKPQTVIEGLEHIESVNYFL
ncbi:MAG: glycosyltransferase family 9 protein [Chitinispirillales bacterium]|jgi:heptosyltransferase-2|nr:glycosyltransferase family 9 protein [Chitinispirillales bacterium]